MGWDIDGTVSSSGLNLLLQMRRVKDNSLRIIMDGVRHILLLMLEKDRIYELDKWE